jgi:zinc transporter ZupT
MLAAEQRRRTAFLASAAIGSATMIGILSVFLLTGLSEQAMGIAFSFSAGAATYVGASDLIPEINHSRNRVIPLMVFAGMLLFYSGTLVLAPLGIK